MALWKKALIITLSTVWVLFITVGQVFYWGALLHRHKWEVAYEVAATCDVDGVSVYACDCGDSKIKNVKALGHNLLHYAAKAPTCETVGWAEYAACKRCAYTTFVEIPAIAHEFNAENICENCEKGEDELLEGHTHVCVETVIVTLPTCVDEGQAYSICSCGYKELVVVKAFGHLGGGATCSTEGICERCSLPFYDPEKHVYENGSCICGAVDSDYEQGGENNGEGEGEDEDDSSQGDLEGVQGGIELIPTPALFYELDKTESYYICTGFASETETKGQIIIPSEHKGKPVKEIEKAAFQTQTGIVRVVLGENLTTIGANAFYNCLNLVEVCNLSKNITDVAKVFGTAVSVCTEKEESKIKVIDGFGVYDSGTKKQLVGYFGNATQLILPAGVTEIGQGVFNTCENLEKVVLNDELENLKTHTFKDIRTLKSVTIGLGLKEINRSAFSDLERLEEVIFTDAKGWVIGSNANPCKESELLDAGNAASLLLGEEGKSNWIKEE